MIQTRLTKFVSETRDMWRYMGASSILCLVTLLCIVCTGPAQSTHRQLGHAEIAALHLRCMTYVKCRDDKQREKIFVTFKALCEESQQKGDLLSALQMMKAISQPYNTEFFRALGKINAWAEKNQAEGNDGMLGQSGFPYFSKTPVMQELGITLENSQQAEGFISVGANIVFAFQKAEACYEECFAKAGK